MRQARPPGPRVAKYLHGDAVGVARRGGLVWLTSLLLIAAAVSWTARLLVQTGTLDARPLRGLSDQALLLVVAAGASLVALVAFRSAQASLRHRGGRSVVALLRLESVASVVLAVLVVAVLAGETSGALLGVGLVGFGLTLALQRPILAVAGWAAVRFGRLFREGDRIEVGGIVGDVLDVGLFTTRVWEVGSRDSPLPSAATVSPLRPTGRIVTVSNAMFVEHPVANATADIGHVFDEFAVTVAYEADRALAERLLREVGDEVLDPADHARAAENYARLTRGMPLEAHFPERPLVLLALQDSWIEMRLRYLVPARGRAVTRSLLAERWLAAAARHPDRLPNVYPRAQPMPVGGDGRPVDGRGRPSDGPAK